MASRERMFAELFANMILAAIGGFCWALVVADLLLFGVQTVVLGFAPERIFRWKRAGYHVIFSLTGALLIYG